MGRQHQSRQTRRANERRAQERAQRAQRSRRRNTNWSILGGGAIVVAAIIVFLVFALKGGGSTAAAGSSTSATPQIPNGPTIGGINCDQGMTAGSFHIHAHLAILDKGKPVTIGSDFGHDYNHDCLYWLHAHSDYNGIIHMESPHTIHPPLATWLNIARETLPQSGETVPRLTPLAGEQEKVYVNMKPYYGDPLKIKLYNHTQVTIEFGPPFVAPQPFDFAKHQV